MSVHQHTPTSDQPQYSDIATDMGEDPARFLAVSEQYLLARIRGVTDRGLLSAYRAVELREFGGREIILEAIATRERTLEI